MIFFDPGTHTYQDKDGNIFDSPSKILNMYKNHFPAQEAARKYARKHGYTPQYWLNQWKQKGTTAIERGNAIHSDKEEADFGHGYAKANGRLMQVENAERYQIKDLSLLPDGIYPEIVVWNEGWRISGKPDRAILSTKGSVRTADIEDYKTNWVIKKISDVYNGQHKMMLGPVKHLMDSNYWHYCLQLSFYQYMLETHGFKPGYRRLIHIPHPIIGVMGEEIQPADEIIEIPYLKAEVIAILKDYNRKRTFDKAKR